MANIIAGEDHHDRLDRAGKSWYLKNRRLKASPGRWEWMKL
jgi:hypothetical protein